MKKHRIIFALLFCPAVVSAGLAAEPSAAAGVASTVPAGVPARVAFLGVAYVAAPPPLAARLGLPEGVGLVVTDVLRDGPAAATLKPDDLLVSLDAQKFTDATQLGTLVRSHQPGDEVTLVYLRAGRENSARLKLAQRETAALPPPAKIEQLNLEYEETPRNEMSATELMMNDQGYSPVRKSSVYQAGDTRTTYTDGSGVIEVTRASGKQSVVARNPAGTVVFSGPFNTEAERLAAPPSVQARAEWVATQFQPLRDGVATPPTDDAFRRILPTR